MTQSATLGAVPTGTGATVRAGFNAACQALVTESEGASPPALTWPFLRWRDDTAKLVKRRNASNTAWEIIENYGATVDPTANDDAGDGYVPGSLWVNVGSNKVLVCTRATTAAAVWAELTNVVTAINGGPLAGLRNAVINGNFDFWQRGTTLAAGTGGGRYLADRWQAFSSNTTIALNQGVFTLGQGVVPNEPKYYLSAVVASVAGAANYGIVLHRIEGVRTFAGRTAMLSFWAKADANKPMSVTLQQNFGTGGAPSGSLYFGGTKVNLTTSWQQFTVPFTVPSIAGKTLGSNNNDLLAISFWLDAGTNWDATLQTLGQQSGTFDVACVQLEPGAVATPFEGRPIGMELALCRRYYEKSFPQATAPAQNAGVAGASFFGQTVGAAAALTFGSVAFKVAKRAAPTITLYNPSAANAQVRNTGANADCTASTAANVSENGFELTATTAAGSAAGQGNAVHWTASAEL